ncbi:MAG: hypothetical protein HBSAPP01_13870 [Candidatus Brocadia sapporoensis]|nr:MAG: hypothetical protein HBSAPP01_13870 [Candidatus Brocadia sapporoensis]
MGDPYLLTLVEKTEANTQEKVKEVAADCGYESYANYEYSLRESLKRYTRRVQSQALPGCTRLSQYSRCERKSLLYKESRCLWES